VADLAHERELEAKTRFKPMPLRCPMRTRIYLLSLKLRKRRKARQELSLDVLALVGEDQNFPIRISNRFHRLLILQLQQIRAHLDLHQGRVIVHVARSRMHHLHHHLMRLHLKNINPTNY
jgi:hypothetical protein